MSGITGFQLNSPATLSPAAATSSPSKPFPHCFSPLPFSKKSIPGLRCRPMTGIVTARFGGGGYRPSSGGSRRNRREPRPAGSDYDATLDLDRVKSTSVRLLNEQQTMIGVVSKSEAIQMAEDAELILAILSVDADPPVLRLFDPEEYKKHKFEQLKKKRVQQKKSSAKRVDIKELKMGYNIDSHDYSVRLRAAQKFLKDGDKVKVMVNLKGRENEFRNMAIELLKRFQNDVGELAMEESKSFSDRNMFLVMMPNKAVLQKAQEQPKKKEIAAAAAAQVSAGV